MRDAATVDVVAGLGAEWIGFVFFPPSPRALSPKEAAALAGGLAERWPQGPKPVGLFVDPSDGEIAETLAAVPLAALQVNATAARAAEIEARFGVPVWHAIGIASRADLPASAPGVARLLLDHKAPPAAPLPGGNAQSFDWSVLRGWVPPLPWLLAGGLTPGNVAGAIRETGASAVDVSSGVESRRGVKDPGLIDAFIRAVRSRP